MTLAGALETVLLQFLGPYVEGLDLSSLHRGILRGNIEIKNIRIKPDLLAQVGIEGFRLDDSKIGAICINIPWNAVYTGKISAVVEGVHAKINHSGEARSDEAILKALREGRSDALAARVEQIRTTEREKQRAKRFIEGNTSEAPDFITRVVYKFVNNITIKITGVEAGFQGHSLGVGVRAGLGELAVLSTDAQFTKTSDEHTVESSGTDMHKLLRLTNLFLQVSSAADGALEASAPYVLTPCGFSAQLSHMPEKELVKVAVDLGTDRVNKLTVMHSQLVRLMHASAALAVEQEHAERLLAPSSKAQPLLAHLRRSKEEYGNLRYSKLVKKDALPEDEAQRLQFLEDVLPLQILAAQRFVAEESFAKNGSTGLWGRVAKLLACAADGFSCTQQQAVLDHEARGEWDTTTAESLESIDVPQKLDIKVQSGRLVLSIVDDRHEADDAARQLLALDIQGTAVDMFLRQSEDHRGNPSAEFKISTIVREISAMHGGSDVIRLATLRDNNSVTEEPTQQMLGLQLNSTLGEDHNLLSVKTQLLPLDIYLRPSLLRQLLSFAEVFNSEDLPPHSPAPSHISTPSLSSPAAKSEGLSDVDDEGFAVPGGLGAAHYVDGLYQRAPDRISLDVDIHAPTVHVPLNGIGKLSLRLGHLKCVTPGPCEVVNLQLAISLSGMVVKTVSHSGQVFEVVQPTHIGVELVQGEDEDTISVRVGVRIKTAEFAMKPQALQIIMSVVNALTPPEQVMEAAKSIVDTASAEGKLEGFLDQAALASEALKHTDAAKKLEAILSKKQRIDVTVNLEALKLVVWDGAVPFLRLTSTLTESMTVICEGNATGMSTAVQVPEIGLHLRALNYRSGAWEPILEDFRLEVGVMMQPGEGTAGDEASMVTNVICTALTPLLLNVVPSTIHQILQIVPVFASAAEPVEEKEAAPGDSSRLCSDSMTATVASAWTTYRAINLSDETLEVVIGEAEGKNATVSPTGSEWVSLDDLIWSTYATTITVRLVGGELSAPINVECCGAVAVPGTSCRAELLTHREGHRVLLLAPPLRINNATDLLLQLDFLDANDKVQTQLALPTSICDGALLGKFMPEHTGSKFTGTQAVDVEDSEVCLLLPPNAILAVPGQLLIGGKDCVQLRAKPAFAGVEFSKAVKVGAAQEALVLECALIEPTANHAIASPGSYFQKRKPVGVGWACFSGKPSEQQPAAIPSENILHLRLEVEESKNYLPDPMEATTFTTIVLKPPLTLLNAVPTDSLVVGCVEDAKGLHTVKWNTATIPRMTGYNFYSTSGVDVRLRVSLENGAPRSKVMEVALQGETGPASVQSCDLAGQPDGAGGGVVLEVVARGQVRLSCPLWLIERAGLSDLGHFAVHYEGKPLPCCGGITLLPSDAFEETCELVLDLPSGGKMSHKMRMPTNCEKFAWAGSTGLFNICMQTEDVAPVGVLGAACKVLVVRPRLMLTNSSSIDVEICLYSPIPKKRTMSGMLLGRCQPSTSTKPSTDERIGYQLAAQADDKFPADLHRLSELGGHFWKDDKAEPLVEEDFEKCHLTPGRIVTLLAGKSHELHVHPKHGGLDEKLLAAVFSFREAGREDDAWAGPVTCSDNSVGRRSWLLTQSTPEGEHSSVWSVAVAAGRCALDVAFDRGSEIVAVNRVRSLPRPIMTVQPLGPGKTQEKVARDFTPGLLATQEKVARDFTPAGSFAFAAASSSRSLGSGSSPLQIPVLGRTPTPIGWPKQKHDGNCSWEVLVSVDGTAYHVKDVRLVQRICVQAEGRHLEITVSRMAGKMVVSLEERQFLFSGQLQETIVNLEVKLSHAGVSVMQESPFPSELLLFSMDFVHVQYSLNQTTDVELLRVSVADAQLDCQLQNRQESMDGEETPVGKENFKMLAPETRAVLLCKQTGLESEDFLSVHYQKDSASSQDTIFSELVVHLTPLELCFDSGWFEPLLGAIDTMVGVAAQEIGLPYARVAATADRRLSEDYQPLSAPAAFIVEGMRLSSVDVKIWVSLPFESFNFLPKYIRTTLQVMCFSRHFTLKGASLRLPAKDIPASRGSAQDFVLGLATEYSFALVRSVASILGKSSLLNLPAAPIVLGVGAASMVTDRVSHLTGEAAAHLSKFTMDTEYAARHQAQQDAKQIDHAGDGVLEAGKSLAEGARGLFDIVVKPIEGARDGGVKGFAKGVGLGVAGTLFKPIVGIGLAVSDLGTGVAATVAAGPALKKKRTHHLQRARIPRLLFGHLGEVRPYSLVEAAVLQTYGADFAHAISEILPLVRKDNSCALLVLFRTSVVIVEFLLPHECVGGSGKPKDHAASSAPLSDGLLHQHFKDVFVASLEGRGRALQFSELSGCVVFEKEARLVLIDRSKKEHCVQLLPDALDDDSLAALQKGFACVFEHPSRVANWLPLRRLLDDAKLSAALLRERDTQSGRERTVEVIEVQRRQLKQWKAPYLPTDGDLTWMWVDKRGRRHPNLINKQYPKIPLTKEQAVSKEKPPCALDPKKYQPCQGSEWTVQVQAGTDAEGWMYAAMFGSPNWAPKATMMDQMRKRVWVRKFA